MTAPGGGGADEIREQLAAALPESLGPVELRRRRAAVSGGVRWWARWLVRYAPMQALRRMTSCRRAHRGPMHDGWVCLHCGAPWFGRPLRPRARADALDGTP